MAQACRINDIQYQDIEIVGCLVDDWEEVCKFGSVTPIKKISDSKKEVIQHKEVASASAPKVPSQRGNY
jgi:hypothetical protein